jgi:hypothetical protein
VGHWRSSVDLGQGGWRGEWGRRRGREGKLGEARAGLLLLWWAERSGCVWCGRVGRKTGSSFLGELKDFACAAVRMWRMNDAVDQRVGEYDTRALWPFAAEHVMLSSRNDGEFCYSRHDFSLLRSYLVSIDFGHIR